MAVPYEPSPNPPPAPPAPTIGGLRSQSTNGSTAWQYRPPEADLVSGRMALMRRQNDPYMQQSKQGAMELANARGQMNSDYAAGAAQRAAIEAALPIAAQDSETLTRVGLSNADAQRRKDELELQKQIASASAMSATGYSYNPAEQEREYAHQLQLQRERLAFEGEQGGLGRGHDYGMGLMGIEAGLYGDQMGYDNARQLGYDQYGFGLGLAEQGFGHDLGRMGAEYGYNRGLAELGADLGLRSDFFNNQFGMQRDMSQMRGNTYMQMILQGMQVPEFMANPEAFLGFTQSILGFNFDQIFGGRG